MRFARPAIIIGLLLGWIAFTTPATAQDEPPPTPAPPTTVNATIPPSTDTVEVQANIAYYEGGPTLDVYLPKNGQANRPALIMVHGGGWNGGDKAEFAPFALQAATYQQWVVVDVDYRLSATDPAAWPDELHDVQAAIRYIAANAQQYGIDPHKILALGESAGANLVALISSVGTANPIAGDAIGNDPTLAVRIRGVGLWSPPIDLAALYSAAGQPPSACGPDQACDFTWTQGAIGQYFRCDPTGCPDSYRSASPLTWVSAGTAPSFVANSTDELVPLAQVEQYVTTLQAAKVGVGFVPLPGSLHAIQYGAAVWPQTVAFLAAQLVDPPPETTTVPPPPTTVTSTASPPTDTGDTDNTPRTLIAILSGAAVLLFVFLGLRRLRSGGS